MNELFLKLLVKLNLMTVKNGENESLKDKIKNELKDEKILAINMEGDIPVVRLVLKGKKADIETNDNYLIERECNIRTTLLKVTDKFKLYLIDEKYKIIQITDQDGNILTE